MKGVHKGSWPDCAPSFTACYNSNFLICQVFFFTTARAATRVVAAAARATGVKTRRMTRSRRKWRAKPNERVVSARTRRGSPGGTRARKRGGGVVGLLPGCCTATQTHRHLFQERPSARPRAQQCYTCPAGGAAVPRGRADAGGGAVQAVQSPAVKPLSPSKPCSPGGVGGLQ